MNVRRAMSKFLLVTVLAVVVASLWGCLTSESHWGDSKSNSATNNGDSSNATTNNQSINNNAELDGGSNTDVGDDGSCFANRFDDEVSMFAEARCVPDEDGITCTCFDGATQSSSTGLCEDNLIDLCGATPEELGRCIVDSNTCEATSDGFSCTCAAAAPVTSAAETCAEAMWESCFAQTGCGNTSHMCETTAPFVYACSCDGVPDRAVDALRCEDALQACRVGSTFDGCTAQTGTCDRTEDGYLCSCVGGAEVTVLDAEAGTKTCEEVLEESCAL